MFRDHTEALRFEWQEAGHVAFADYFQRDGVWVLPHVEAPPTLRGTGAAGRLMEAVVAHARAQGLKLRPVCSYAVAWFARHPDAQDVVG
jgi:predicted GNAT family acetyltransferase